MYEHKTNKVKVEDRIVSISQPYVRAIVRGKAVAPTEFGSKIAISLVNVYKFLEKISWNNFNEENTLIASSESYKKRGIRLSGPIVLKAKKKIDPLFVS